MAIIIAYYIHITYLGQLLVNSGFIKMFYQIAFINAKLAIQLYFSMLIKVI